MAITFDEALEQLEPRTIWSHEMRDLLEQLRATYAPTIEMTQNQYDTFNSAIFSSRESNNDFIYFIDILEVQSKFDGEIFENELSAYRNDSRYLMQAWLHPETIKVVD